MDSGEPGFRKDGREESLASFARNLARISIEEHMTDEQWGKREGYRGPGSFPKEVMGFVRERSKVLAGQQHSLYLADGRVLAYDFTDSQRLSVKQLEGTEPYEDVDTEYRAFEGASGIFIVSHTYPFNARLNTSLILDFNREQVVVVDGEIPSEGDDDFRVRETRSGGYIGKPSTPGEIIPPPFPTDMVGRRIAVSYAGVYDYEAVFLTETHLAWHCIKGNAGLAAVEEYQLSQLAPNIFCLSWSEQEETLQAVMLMNFDTGEINGNMFGYDPQSKEILNMVLGSEIIDPSEFGVKVRGVIDPPNSTVLQRNKDVVLRSHFEVWNRAKYELIDELYGEEFVSHFICDTGASGRIGMRDFIMEHRESFPDWTERVVDIFAEGDRVVTRYQSTGTHNGIFQGIAATGIKMTVNEVSIYRVHNGQIIEQWGFPDGLSIFRQLTEG
ncbi:MAG: steroid delta-isomerase-like uncharacterized protein [Halieaceae bacterium]|jgi:steroid delta-isomerase-like uncharacterized protein